MSSLPPWGMEGPQARSTKEGYAKTAQTIIGPCNCGRKLGKITSTGKKETRKGIGYNKGWGTCTNIRIN